MGVVAEGDWVEYFKVKLGGESEKSDEVVEESEIVISSCELESALGRMRNGRAVGLDGVAAEAWKYGGEGLREAIRGMFNEIGREGMMPVSWSRGKIIPVWKGRGDKRDMVNYRGITIMDALYKLYARILAARVVRAGVEMGLVGETQFGFREGVGAIDAVRVVRDVLKRG